MVNNLHHKTDAFLAVIQESGSGNHRVYVFIALDTVFSALSSVSTPRVRAYGRPELPRSGAAVMVHGSHDARQTAAHRGVADDKRKVGVQEEQHNRATDE